MGKHSRNEKYATSGIFNAMKLRHSQKRSGKQKRPLKTSPKSLSVSPLAIFINNRQLLAFKHVRNWRLFSRDFCKFSVCIMASNQRPVTFQILNIKKNLYSITKISHFQRPPTLDIELGSRINEQKRLFCLPLVGSQQFYQGVWPVS